MMGQQFCRMMPHHPAIRGLGQGKYESRVHLVFSYQSSLNATTAERGFAIHSTVKPSGSRKSSLGASIGYIPTRQSLFGQQV